MSSLSFLRRTSKMVLRAGLRSVLTAKIKKVKIKKKIFPETALKIRRN